MNAPLRIGTRRGALATWQAQHIADLLTHAQPTLSTELHFIETEGDREANRPLPEIGGKGVFTEALETALLSGAIHIAVHSLKDLPTTHDARFTLAAIPERGPAADALISRDGHTLETLPHGAMIGTSSTRRAAQLRAFRPDLQILNLRGNVPTRLQKALARESGYDAIVLALAGLERLALMDTVTQVLPFALMLPAPAQGALVAQCLAANGDVRRLLAPLDHHATRRCVTAERAFLSGLGSGCTLPVAALGEVTGDILHLIGRVGAHDGSQMITVEGDFIVNSIEGAQRAGADVATEALARGAAALLR